MIDQMPTPQPLPSNREAIVRPLHKVQTRQIPQEYMDVAQGMETQFINNMIKEMRKSIPKYKPADSVEEFYNSLIDYERSVKMAATQGVGLKEVILEQIYPNYNKPLDRRFKQDSPQIRRNLRNSASSKQEVQQ
jgi:Rod binding domain-containing protein